MRNLAYVMLLLAFGLYACKPAPDKSASSSDEKTFFPVNAYIAEQLHIIDSLQLPVARYYTGEGREDTTALSLEECRALAAPFLETDISDPKWKDQYVENSFADQSIPSVSFNYQTIDSALPVKRVDIVLKPDPVKTDKVKSVYIEKLFKRGDTLINEKLYWKADHYFQVISTKQTAASQPVITKLKVAWDPSE